MAKGNPYHLPGGSPKGGEFTSGPVAKNKAAMETNTVRGHQVENDSVRADASRLVGKSLEEGQKQLSAQGYSIAHNQITGKPIVGDKLMGGTQVYGFHKNTGPYSSGHFIGLHTSSGGKITRVTTSGPHISRD